MNSAISFGMIFHEALETVYCQGKHPIICLLGPDMQEAFTDHCGHLGPWMKMKPGDPWLEDSQPGDLGLYNGLRLRKMEHNGLALITTPQPESGFDLV